jgi:alginate O-acetyltransferase complex protein AlgI
MIYPVIISAIVIISVLIYWFLIPNRWRNIFLLIVSLLLISAYNLKHAAYFLFNAALVYKGSIFLERKVEMRKNLLKIILFWLIGNLCFFKYGQKIFAFLPHFRSPGILFPLGLSYITFRLVHYIVEIYRKSISRAGFVDFLLYIFFFPTFIAGPVDRFGRFQPQAASAKNIQLADLNSALYRIICGLTKKFIIADSLARCIMPVLYAPQEHPRFFVVCAVYGFALRIYMDFAGYTDIALGVSKLFGYTIMENFDRPFLKSNIALFWRSWNISVYSWIRDYFFLPFFGYRASEIKIYIGIFCSMMLFSLWHAGSLNFLLLGIYHGLGLVVWQLFQEIKKKHPGVRTLVSRASLDPLSSFCTFTFVSFGFILFIPGISSVRNILLRLF